MQESRSQYCKVHRNYSCIRQEEHRTDVYILRSVSYFILNKVGYAGCKHRKKRNLYKLPIDLMDINQCCQEE